MKKIILRGSGLLKVVSIIMIIYGAITVASGASSMSSGRTLVSMLGVDPSAIPYFQMIGAISLLSGAVMLVFGILGLRFSNRAERINLLLILGIVQIVVTVFTTIYHYMMAPALATIMEQVVEAAKAMGSAMASNINIGGAMQNVPMMAVGFILPVLYIIGAVLNKRPPKEVYEPGAMQ